MFVIYPQELEKATNHLNPPDCDHSFAQQESMAAAATEDLVAAGWEVTDGHMIFTSGHAFGNNPSSVKRSSYIHE